MKPHIKIDITAGTLRSMSIPQFEALRAHILNDGVWDTVDEEIRISGGGESYLGVELPNMFIGIEPDGYTHS